MMKAKVIVIITLIILLGTLSGIGTYAWFVSQATSSYNTFTVGELKISNDYQLPNPTFSMSVDGVWYPGLTVGGDKHVNIKNIGSLDTRIVGISAEIKSFNKDNLIKAKFADWLNIKIEAPIGTQPMKKKVIYEGPLSQLMNKDPKTFSELIVLKPYDIITNNLNESTRAFFFEATLSEEADNDIQRVTAIVDFTFHATQDNNEAVADLLGNN